MLSIFRFENALRKENAPKSSKFVTNIILLKLFNDPDVHTENFNLLCDKPHEGNRICMLLRLHNINLHEFNTVLNENL